MRWRMLAAVAAGIIGVSPGVAVAREAGPVPELQLELYSRGMPAGASAGKVLAARYGVRTGTPPPRATFRLDATAAAPWLRITTAEPTPGCTQDEAVLTCTLDIASPDWTRNVLLLRYTPAPGAEPGTEVTFDVDLTADGAVPVGYRQGFTLTGPRPDMSAAFEHLEGVRPGSRVPLYPRFANVGDDAASGVLLQATLPSKQPARDRYRNCYYSGDQVQCPFPEFRLAPGERAAVSRSTPLTASVPSWVPGLSRQEVAWTVDPMPAGVPFDPGDARPGSGPELRLDRQATTFADSPDADYLDNGGVFYLHTTSNPADLSAGAGRVRGRTGDTVTMSLRFTNHGPAQVSGPAGDEVRWNDPAWASLTVDVPSGVDVVSSGCYGYVGDVLGRIEPGLPRYRCFIEDPNDPGTMVTVDPGTTVTVGLRVRLRSDTTSVGLVTAAGGVDDPRPGNDAARIEVWPVRPAPGDDSGQGGGLPITGTPAGVRAALGGVLVLVGALLIIGAARVRSRR
ncbi:hypothetical protein [Nucisporomicrobium flavum]|uniref:hypothetical protein n=1 Tax=Nucisporomicrobium flavum TaxID=2785915 RepID=UPI0018F636D3|nr:hypothetical protein [Nucisporomicrobium flavum]